VRVDRGAAVLVDGLRHLRDDVHRATLGDESMRVVTLVRAKRRQTRHGRMLVELLSAISRSARPLASATRKLDEQAAAAPRQSMGGERQLGLLAAPFCERASPLDPPSRRRLRGLRRRIEVYSCVGKDPTNFPDFAGKCSLALPFASHERLRQG
jgi:hypothetical protein